MILVALQLELKMKFIKMTRLEPRFTVLTKPQDLTGLLRIKTDIIVITAEKSP